MEIELLQNPAADDLMSNLKRKRNRKRKQRAKKKAMEKNPSVPTNNLDENSKVWSERSDCTLENCDSDKNLADTDFSGRTPAECPTMTAGSTESLSEVSANREKRTKWRRKKKKKKKAKKKRDAQALSINQAKMDKDIEPAKMDKDIEPTKNVAEGKVNKKRKKRQKNIKNKAESKVEAQNLSEGDHGRVIDPKVYSSERKLLVLDVNGLLADILIPAPKNCRGDTHILGRAVFKRPFCDDFLKFCFQNFDVGIWSSRSKKIIDRVVEYLLGDLQDRLLFCWDMLHCTQTGFRTLENYHKPLVCKELRKIWESDGPDLRWKKGQYNESNTLLLDDSPYKALLNPLHTAIFPNSYSYKDKSDNSLGPGGNLRVYLEGLLKSENVQKYVEQHPFGQSAINQSTSSWGFYSGVLRTMSIQVGK